MRKESNTAFFNHWCVTHSPSIFSANPDLPQRFALKAELNTPDRATMFGGGEQGYIDYPFLAK